VHPGEIAAIILEPVVGNAGCIPPAAGYLEGLRAITANHGALLIVDEVMTGFRLALGGALELYRLDADLVTLGKIIGGGLPCGAFGGKRQFMELLAPLGPVYQAGTLSGNPLAMAAGLATVGHLKQHAAQIYPQLEAVSKSVAEGVAAEAAKAGVPMTLNRVGSMWTWFFTPDPVADYDDAARSDTAAFGRFHRAMLDAGIWLPPSQFEAMFLSTAHGATEVEATVAAARDAFASIRNQA
jgi:glutamate-1-semialdehyde 2,1-aminomutase